MPRFLHRLYASLRGYFWLPCPICGTYFGGHEWTESIPGKRAGTGVGVCPWCAPTARRAHEAMAGGIKGAEFIGAPHGQATFLIPGEQFNLELYYLNHLIIEHCPKCPTKRRSGYIYPQTGSGLSWCSNCRS